MKDQQNDSPLIVHILHHLIMGGLENGLVNLINKIPQSKYRHVVICLSHFSEFKNRITRPDVEIIALHKKQGKDIGALYNLWKLLRKIKPDIVHTRNLAALECNVVAAMAGVKHRIHGEHGRDIYDVDGSNLKYLKLRRYCQPFVNRYIALSKDLEGWLINDVRIPKRKIVQLYNGVDLELFKKNGYTNSGKLPKGFATNDNIVIGTVGRMQPIKDSINLAKAFVSLVKKNEQYKKKLRLIMVGDGPLKSDCENILKKAGLSDIAWLPGARDDVPVILESMDIFVLPSLGEGISNTILEAMATGLPVVATNVGGNIELVKEDETGFLVQPNSPEQIANGLEKYVRDNNLIEEHGKAARNRVEKLFSLDRMVKDYVAIYDNILLHNSKTEIIKN